MAVKNANIVIGFEFATPIVGRAGVLYANRFGYTPTLGSGGQLIGHTPRPVDGGRPGYVYETETFVTVVGVLATGLRVRILNGAHKGEVVTVNDKWIVVQ
ncbi:hypothetical protein SEA_CECE_337 [Microbacterium phage Cece]|nr:hypothetical protein SEA_CECE_35 [Microbacterium phage Cece]UVG35343.1 hypothetical protein SEA_CECE_337 [Microbacterium phage Cece]